MHHALHTELVNIFEAFADAPDEMVLEMRDMLLCKEWLARPTGRAARVKLGRATVGSIGSGSGRLGSRSTASHISAVPEVDPVWVLVSLAMVFFYFTAAASHVLFLDAGSPLLAPVAYWLTGLLSLYELFGSNSILGWDTRVQAIAHRVRDMLVAVFFALVAIEVHAVFSAVSSADGIATKRLFWFWRDTVGFALSIFWLLSLRLHWRVMYVASVLVTLLGIYAGSVLASNQIV